MAHTQNIEAIISQLMEEEKKLSSVYEEAEEQSGRLYDRVLLWEEAYTASNENEEVGQKLDEIYDEYNEADKTMREAEEKVEAIKDALKALRKAVEAIKWLGL